MNTLFQRLWTVQTILFAFLSFFFILLNFEVMAYSATFILMGWGLCQIRPSSILNNKDE